MFDDTYKIYKVMHELVVGPKFCDFHQSIARRCAYMIRVCLTIGVHATTTKYLTFRQDKTAASSLHADGLFICPARDFHKPDSGCSKA